MFSSIVNTQLLWNSQYYFHDTASSFSSYRIWARKSMKSIAQLCKV